MKICKRRMVSAAAVLLAMSLCAAAAGAAQQCEPTESLAEEVSKLRQEVQAMREQLDALQRAHGETAADEQELLRAKVNDLEQTKIESGSKHHVRLSGLALLNVAATRGSVDDFDLPATAAVVPAGQTNGSVNFGVRQSFLNLEVFGPTLGGARTSAGVALDFFGGFPASDEGVSSPLVRLRTATFRMEWGATSMTAGQDVLFFSPRSPTSLVSMAYPALSSAGNMWSWTPQVRVEHGFTAVNGSAITIQAGILDPLSGELPASEYSRLPTAGERSRVPAQAVRVAWQSSMKERHAGVGAGAYHANQNWGFDRSVDAWVTAADWDVPLGAWFALSGEVYRGQAIAGLGAGASTSVLFAGAAIDAATILEPVNTAGGWSQLKFKPTTRLEFNAAYGEDNPFRGRLKRFLTSGAAALSVNRNASAFVNAIFQARSNLLFSIEYRRLWTSGLDDITHAADHVSLSTGVGF